LYVHSMYSKGNEQVLERILGKGKTKSFELFFFVLILDVFRAAIYFCFSPGNEFCFSSVLKLQICFVCQCCCI
jgi:hypothetical protein